MHMADTHRQPFWHSAAFAWGFAEATLFFIVPDVLLSWIGLKRGARAGALASGLAALGAGLGGTVMYLWSAAQAEAARAAVLAVPAINEGMARAAEAAMAEHGWAVATLLGPLSTTPYKLYAVLAPDAGAPLLAFALVSVLVRLPRFLILALVPALIARWLEPRVGMRALALTLGLGWVAFYALYWALTPS
jgi:membrane protein YqaA with SNARE-associated domain